MFGLDRDTVVTILLTAAGICGFLVIYFLSTYVRTY
jgi:hypothetical protein